MNLGTQRLEPLGASDGTSDEVISVKNICSKCTCLEEEKEFLQSSLFTLTTHFAQVQFRLCQVVNAPYDEQVHLIKSLEEFACSDVNILNTSDVVADNVQGVVRTRRDQQRILLEKLKFQLKQLRKFDVQSRKAEMKWTDLSDKLDMKKKLVEQLRTQIVDLQRHIQDLKDCSRQCSCKRSHKTFKAFLYEIMQRSFSVLQVFALIHFGSECFKNHRTNHWGDLRARLEIAIITLQKMLHSNEDPNKITVAVRKCLSTSIRDLIQHGTKTHHILPFLDCFTTCAITHSWEIILYYYYFKNGDKINSSTFQKLSRSFNLSIAGVSPKSNKKNLLYVIEEIISTHSRYKRSHDSHFKAFVCAALNAKQLVNWLNLIFRCGSVIETFYYPWSYVATTRYQDGLRSLDILTPYKFNLPVDLDVKKFQIENNVFA